MRRCVECHKRLLPIVSICVLSRLGWMHLACLDERIRLELLEALEKEIRDLRRQVGNARTLHKEHS
jgi:hypothetical protein